MTKTNIRKRAISILLILMVMLTMTPMTASAADGFVEVSTYEQLKKEVDKGSAKIKLTADIDTTRENSGVGVTTATNLRFKGSGNVLDLNGHKLKLVSNMSVYFIEILSSDLTIKDSGTNGRIDFEYGGSVFGVQRAVVISRSMGVKKAGSLTVDGGTLSSSYHGIILIESFGSITINGGRLYAPVSNLGNGDYLIHSTNRYDLDDTLQLHVNGGELDGRVVLKRDDSSATGTLKYKVTPIKITGGTFKQGLYATWGSGNSPEGEPKNAEMTMDSPTVEITGGVFERNNEEYSSYASSIRIDLPTKLRGGTFKNGATIRFVGGKYTWDGTQPQYRASIGNSAILRGNDIRTAYGWSKSDWFEIQSPWIYLSPKGASVTVIPNAWGMESVTLDGKEINYAKDWKGGFEELNNDKAHTLKFTLKPLVTELVNAGYSYRAECDRYLSGSTTPTTDTISDSVTEYSYTIPAGAPAKVYSFALHLNLKKGDDSVGIFSNQHIVKLVVNEAPVAPPTLSGKVYYTSGIVYGHSISTGTGNLPHGFDSSKLLYQWQRSTDSGSTWTDIEDATSGQYTPKPADMGENVRIRVKITAEGYLGEIVGAAVKVRKADNNKLPDRPEVEAQKDASGNYTVKINNFNSAEQEYVYTTIAPTSGNEWPTGGMEIDSSTVTGLTEGNTCYIFTRYKGTATHTAGSLVSRNSIKLFNDLSLQHVLLEGYNSGETIYIKTGESVTLKVSADPINANSWNEIIFKDSSTGTSHIAISNEKITASGTTATAFPNDHSITIAGNSVGSATLDASYSGSSSSYYSRWYVTVYDDSTVTSALRLKNVYTYEDITLSVNDEAELPTELPKLLPENSGYQLEWRIVQTGIGTGGALYKTSDDNITLENGKIKPKAAHTGSASTKLELVAVKEGQPIKHFSQTSRFNVTVTAAPTIALTGITVAPAKVNLANVNDTITLSAVKQPVNAAGDLTWKSDTPAVATVNSTTGEVTAVTKGEATITVSCGSKSASCTVTVAHTHDTDAQSWVYMDPGTHTKTCTAGDDTKFEAHTFSAWAEVNGTNHSRTCSKCNAIGKTTKYSETAAHTWVWVVDTPAAAGVGGVKHEKCTGCNATRNVGTVIPALPNHAASGGGSYAPTTQKPEITIIGSGKAELSADGKTATITAAAGYELASVVLNGKEMGKVEKLTGLKTGDKAIITFRAKAGGKDGKEETDKMIAREVSKLRLTARSARTAKKNVKLVVKSDLKVITDAGYTVKYKFYRSTKKSAGYKAVLTKKAPTYVNTYGKKGTLYYYKVKVMVYDKDGNLIAQTALKQCKYASRLWTK